MSFFGYPEARCGSVPLALAYQVPILNILRPDVEYKNEKKSNPALRGVTLVVAAFLFVVLPLLEIILQLLHSCF